MSGTYGPPGSGSSNSVALTSSLANRLRLLVDGLGSTLYRLTWKEWVTESGRSIPALRASVLRTSDSGCGGWPTPTGEDHKSDGPLTVQRVDVAIAKGIPLPTPAQRLRNIVLLAGWRSPAVSDSEGGPCETVHSKPHPRLNLRSQVGLAGWPTTGAADATRGAPETPEQKKQRNRTGMTLLDVASLAGWKTPSTTEPGVSLGRLQDKQGKAWMPGQRAYDKHTGRVAQTGLQHMAQAAFGPTPTGSSAATGKLGQLNPAHSRWLIGLPAEWDACAPTETLSSLRKRRRS